jgi:hypothetical protein
MSCTVHHLPAHRTLIVASVSTHRAHPVQLRARRPELPPPAIIAGVVNRPSLLVELSVIGDGPHLEAPPTAEETPIRTA